MISEILEAYYILQYASIGVIMGFMIAFVGAIMTITREDKLPLILVGVGLIVVVVSFGYYFQYGDPLNQQIDRDIKEENCPFLKTVYDTINDETRKNDIQDEYIMRCITDKNDLEMLR